LEREKIENARKAGAIAVFKYSPGKKFQAATPSNLPMFYDNEFYEGDKKQDDFYLKKISLPNWDNTPQMPVIEISQVVAEALLPGAESLLPEMQKPDYNMSGFKAREIDNSRFRFKISGDQKVFRARNVLGYIEGEDTEEVIVIGGHYDHVGKYNGFIFNGADDNASGTVGMLTLARAIKESGKKPAKTIVFAAWTGEEQGLWGSKYFVKNIPDNLKVSLNINLDMIGRTSIQDSTDNYLRIQYTKGHEEYEKVFNKVNQTSRLSLDLRYKVDEQPKGGSDFVPFAAQGVPVIALFTGLHRDYHHPNDELEFIDLDKMTKIIQLTYLGLTDIVGFK
jgi:acetylornithine deacetylase/succinyl-diaminopimelate desuccinylase-like protein